MLTIEELKRLGVNTEEGLARCLNNEAFYLKLVNKALEDNTFDQLESAVNSGDLNRGFEIAHSLKGVLGNLSLTPLYSVTAELTELLRAKEQVDYTPYLNSLKENLSRFTALL